MMSAISNPPARAWHQAERKQRREPRAERRTQTPIRWPWC